MAGGALVRYRVKPDRVEENASLIEGVYAELDALQPEGFRYMTVVLDDGVSFVHLATTADGAVAPLPDLPAFQRFVAEIADRCDEPPQTTRVGRAVGSYGF
jgi:hypothetical protein